MLILSPVLNNYSIYAFISSKENVLKIGMPSPGPGRGKLILL